MLNVIGVVSCLAAASITAPAHAQDPRAEHERAEQLFNDGKHAEAATIWENLLRTVGPDKAWRANYNLGLCYAELGEPTLAVERFEAFVARIRAMPEVPPELAPLGDDAASRVEAIRATHGRLELPASPGVKVRIDGGRARDVGFTAYVTPGTHVVEIIGADGTVRQESVEVSAGRALAVQTTRPAPQPVSPPPPPPPPPVIVVDEPPGFPTVLVLLGAGLTAASFVLPGVMFARASDARDEADALGPGHTGYATAREDFEDARTAYELSYLLPAGLGAITATIAIVGAVRMATWTPTAQTEVACTAFGGVQCWLGGSF